MKRYKFCLKDSKEAIASLDAESKEDATRIFAKIKNLSVTDFVNIYVVVLV